jgi:hypothetical protein
MAIAHNLDTPTGFDDLSAEEQLEYVDTLLGRVENRLESRFDEGLVTEVRRRREAHRMDPDGAVDADVVRDRLLAKYS